jgi:hypothetical protein
MKTKRTRREDNTVVFKLQLFSHFEIALTMFLDQVALLGLLKHDESILIIFFEKNLFFVCFCIFDFTKQKK